MGQGIPFERCFCVFFFDGLSPQRLRLFLSFFCHLNFLMCSFSFLFFPYETSLFSGGFPETSFRRWEGLGCFPSWMRRVSPIPASLPPPLSSPLRFSFSFSTGRPPPLFSSSPSLIFFLVKVAPADVGEARFSLQGNPPSKKSTPLVVGTSFLLYEPSFFDDNEACVSSFSDLFPLPTLFHFLRSVNFLGARV